MVQGYPKETHSCCSFGCSLPGSGNEGNPFSGPGLYSGSGYSPFFGYRTSDLGGYPHEQPFEDPYSDIAPEEKSKMIMELMAARECDAERIRRDEARIDELLSKVDELLSLQKASMAAGKELDNYKRLVSN